MGDGYSVAWRVLDAKFWGVPQRRRRIALVADFRGQSAPEILFVRNGVQGDIEESGQSERGDTPDTESGIDKTSKTPVFDFCQRSDVVRTYEDETPTLHSFMGTGGDNTPCVFTMDYAAFNQGENANYKPNIREADYAPTLTSKGAAAVCYGVPLNFRPENLIPQVEESSTLCNGTAPGTHNGVIVYGKVRRLTPLECERLQGYPDGYTDIGDWTDGDGKLHKTSDTARYKALGNSIALPPWKWVLKRLCACYERDATMASLFDGLGGFPYLWEQLNGKGSCLWASEIEPFPIAVTKYHFGEKLQ